MQLVSNAHGLLESQRHSVGSVGTGWWVNRLTVSKSIRVMRKTARKPSFGENDPEHKPLGGPRNKVKAGSALDKGDY